MKSADDTRFEIREVGEGVGKGMFALVPIAKGDFIMEYTGVKLPTAVADESDSRYLFELDENWTLDGADESNTARYINHSCDPNCEADVDTGRILIHAIRDIAAGEELSFDYDEEYYDEFIRPVGCKCRAAKHR